MCCQQTLGRARRATRQTGAFLVELAQRMDEGIWGKASRRPTVEH